MSTSIRHETEQVFTKPHATQSPKPATSWWSSSAAQDSSGVDDSTRSAILESRALQLARETRREGEANEALRVVLFRLAGESYAIELEYVREVVKMRGLTQVPCTPPFVAGIANFRGRIVSMVDLRPVLGLSTATALESSGAILLAGDDMEFGILVEGMTEMCLVPTNSLQPALPVLTARGAEYVRGISAEQVVVLDGAKLLADSRLVVNEEVAA